MNLSNVFEELSRLYESDEEVIDDEETEFLTDENVDEIATEEGPVIEDELESEDEEVASNLECQQVLECQKCGALKIKDCLAISEPDEAGLVNLDDACTFCEEEAGYKVIGSFVATDEDFKKESEETEETEEAELEDEDEAIGEIEQY